MHVIIVFTPSTLNSAVKILVWLLLIFMQREHFVITNGMLYQSADFGFKPTSNHSMRTD
jgi:hypothetical protein